MGFLLNLLSCVKDSYMPAFIVLFAAFCCIMNIPAPDAPLTPLSITLLCVCFVNFIFLFFVKDIKNIFFTLLILTLYIIEAKLFTASVSLLTLKSVYGWIILAMPLNLFFISMIDQNENKTFNLLCFFLAEAALLENLYLSGFGTLPFYFNFISAALWILVFLYILATISLYPSVKNNAFFFASILIFFALFQADDSHSFLVCLLAACTLNFLANITAAVYAYFRDEVTGVYSFNSFPALDPKKLPPKYTIAFFCIDNYSKILKVFKKNLTDKLTKMILKRMLTIQPNAVIYRLKPDEFCFIFFEQDIHQTFDMVEEMRRLIAGTEFVLTKKKILKLTVTPVVSEKHRNDANAAAVLERMHQNFDRRYKFTQNITFCDEIEQAKKNKRGSNRFAMSK